MTDAREPSPIFVDLSVLSSVRHLAVALLVARATHTQVHVSKDDLHRMYSMASGIYPDPGYNEQMWQFSEFFDLYHEDMIAVLPSNPTLSDPSASIALLEEGVQRGWAKTIHGEWGLAHSELTNLLRLPQASLDTFRDWEASLSTFLRQQAPSADSERGLAILSGLGSDAEETVILPKLSAGLQEASRSIGSDYFKTNNKREGWYIHDFGPAPWANPYIRKGLVQDLREGALLGIWFVCDGTREYLTRTKRVSPILRHVAPEHRALINTAPNTQGKLVKAVLNLQSDARIDDVLEVLSNAATLNLVLSAIELDEQDRSASMRTYVAAVGKLFTPRFGRLLIETVQFAVRRRRRSHVDW